MPGQAFYLQAMASVLSVMRAVSVPLGIADPHRPNLSSTLWRTVHDHKDKVFVFDSATSPNTFWVPLADLDFSTNAPVRKLTMAGGNTHAGNASSKFETAKPFTFLAMYALLGPSHEYCRNGHILEVAAEGGVVAGTITGFEGLMFCDGDCDGGSDA